MNERERERDGRWRQSDAICLSPVDLVRVVVYLFIFIGFVFICFAGLMLMDDAAASAASAAASFLNQLSYLASIRFNEFISTWFMG